MEGIIEKAENKGAAPNFDYFVSQRRGHNISSLLWDDLSKRYKSTLVWDMAIQKRPANFINVYKNKNLE